jgi:hypothetical protein
MLRRTAHAALVLGLVVLGHVLGSQAFGRIVLAVRENAPPGPQAFLDFILLCIVTSWAWGAAFFVGMPFIGQAMKILEGKG